MTLTRGPPPVNFCWEPTHCWQLCKQTPPPPAIGKQPQATSNHVYRHLFVARKKPKKMATKAPNKIWGLTQNPPPTFLCFFRNVNCAEVQTISGFTTSLYRCMNFVLVFGRIVKTVNNWECDAKIFKKKEWNSDCDKNKSANQFCDGASGMWSSSSGSWWRVRTTSPGRDCRSWGLPQKKVAPSYQTALLITCCFSLGQVHQKDVTPHADQRFRLPEFRALVSPRTKVVSSTDTTFHFSFWVCGSARGSLLFFSALIRTRTHYLPKSAIFFLSGLQNNKRHK